MDLINRYDVWARLGFGNLNDGGKRRADVTRQEQALNSAAGLYLRSKGSANNSQYCVKYLEYQ